MVQVTLAPVVSSLDSALSSLERPFYIKFCIAAQRYCLSSLIIRIVTNMHLKLFHFSMWLLYLPRDAMQNRGLCCRPVSVCPSRSCIVSRWLKMSNFFLGTLAPCCFLSASAGTQFQVEPLQQAWNTREVCDFRLKSPFLSETLRDRPMVVATKL